jgi:hypothetical protein
MPALTNLTADPTTDKPPRPRRWIPVSLRMVMAIFLLLGVVSTAMVGIPAYRQQVAIRQLRLSGCEFLTRHNVPGWLRRPAWLRRWVWNQRNKLFEEVYWVDLRRAQDPGAELSHLDGLASIHEVILVRTPVTDSDLVQLKGLTNIQELLLTGTSVTDAGLVHLKELTSMKVLKLDNTRVTDAGLAHLRGMTKMEGLSLVGTQVTEVGMQHLEVLPKLRLLVLSNITETNPGVVKLKRALPGLRVSPSW